MNEVNEADERAVRMGQNYLMALAEAREAQDKMYDYDCNADPTGEIEQRLKREFAVRVLDLAIWTRALTKVTL